jgi:hypothetical protein
MALSKIDASRKSSHAGPSTWMLLGSTVIEQLPISSTDQQFCAPLGEISWAC